MHVPPEHVGTEVERRVLRIALALNAMMFIVGLVAGILGQSTSLMADALDMLADAFAYTIALTNGGRSKRPVQNSCRDCKRKLAGRARAWSAARCRATGVLRE